MIRNPAGKESLAKRVLSSQLEQNFFNTSRII